MALDVKKFSSSTTLIHIGPPHGTQLWIKIIKESSVIIKLMKHCSHISQLDLILTSWLRSIAVSKMLGPKVWLLLLLLFHTLNKSWLQMLTFRCKNKSNSQHFMLTLHKPHFYFIFKGKKKRLCKVSIEPFFFFTRISSNQ